MPIPAAVLPFVFIALAGTQLASADKAGAGRTLDSFFQQTPRAEVTASGMTVVQTPRHHVLVAREADDGSLVTACAVTQEAVEAMLSAPAPASKGK